MRAHEALVGVSRLFLDTAPVIYFVERHPIFANRADVFFERLDLDIKAVVSPVTLAECVVGAKQQGLINLEQAFVDVLQQETVLFVDTHAAIAREAARIRAAYNLLLLDATQVATAVMSGCEAILTNDTALSRVTELRVLVLSNLEV